MVIYESLTYSESGLFFADPPLCSHMLANTYFAESITSPVGFWGTSCPNYLQYAFGWCPLVNRLDPAAVSRVLMGEHTIFG